MKKIKKVAFELLFLAPAFLYLCGFLIIITVYLVALSLTYITPGIENIFPSLYNWIEVIQNPEFKRALLNTLIFVLVGTPLELLAGLFMALLVYRSFWGRSLIRSIFIIPLAIPALVTAVILFILFDYPGGHVNNILMGRHDFFPAVINSPLHWRGSASFALGVSLLGKIWRDMPISMLILLSGLNSIEQDQYQAAETMGAGGWHKFRFITLPLLVPAIATVLILRSIEVWKEFIFPHVLAGRFHLLGTLIESFYHDWHNPGQAAVVAVLLLVLVTFSTLILMGGLRWVRYRLVRL
jgi:ABC-type sugar transport system permease subunit